ncbi:MAG: phosphoribosyltransferase family protein [Bacteroidota bacterium]
MADSENITKHDNLILTSEQIKQKIRRIAWEIHERNFRSGDLAVVGIASEGRVFAGKLADELSVITGRNIACLTLKLDKHATRLPQIELDMPVDSLENKTIILTDDVLNSGRTLLYALSGFLRLHLSKVQTAVIVERSHRQFPIAADYVGHSLSTTVGEHVDVRIDSEGNMSAYLN